MKKSIFTIILILIPVIFFLLIEIALRLAGFGTSYPLFIQEDNNWRLNRTMAAKYFSSRDILIPELIDQSFPVSKPDNTVRILCLGGSTTAGYPYEVNINFPFFLQLRLERMFPAKDFELINLGISAVNSYTVMDIAGQLATVKPDLVLIYMGHNEFYGALGAASAEYAGLSRPLIKLMLTMREWRLYQALQKLFDIFRETSAEPNSNLMQAMIAKQSILYGSDEFNYTHENFHANLKDILEDLSDDDIPVILATVVSNLRDQKPLSSLANPGDSQPALESYQAGQNLLLSGDHMAAFEEFSRARDLDMMRFRAASRLNDIIHQVTDSLNIPLADVEDAFVMKAQFGIPGNDLFLEHLHPNPAGYDLMAVTFLKQIIAIGVLGEEPEGDLRNTDIKKMSGYTLLDELIGELKIENMVSNYPFNGQTKFQKQQPDDKMVLKKAQEHIKGDIWWDEAHFKLGDYFLQKEEYSQAAREYDAVRIASPDNPTPYYKLARVAEVKENYLRAEQLYKQSIELHDKNHFLYAKLSLLYLAMNRFLDAIATLDQVINLEDKEPQLTLQEQIQLYYYLAVANAQIGQLKKAKVVLEQVLKQDNSHERARDLLDQVNMYMKK